MSNSFEMLKINMINFIMKFHEVKTPQVAVADSDDSEKKSSKLFSTIFFISFYLINQI